MSRWTSPRACAAASALVTCNAISIASADRQRPVLEPLAQRHAFDQLRDDEGPAVQLAEIVNDDDVRMVEARRGVRFLSKPLQPIRVACEILRDQLDGDAAIELLVVRRIDLAHRARADPRQQPVRAERLAAQIVHRDAAARARHSRWLPETTGWRRARPAARRRAAEEGHRTRRPQRETPIARSRRQRAPARTPPSRAANRRAWSSRRELVVQPRLGGRPVALHGRG